VYSTNSGERLGHVSAIKVSAPVRACALTDDGRHLLAAVGNFVFRFEYLGDRQKGAGEAEDGQENMAVDAGQQQQEHVAAAAVEAAA
jgi:hypothetical protein